eukprot:GHVL01026066.1.p1 GENE.GHVL01026066.1~~GHVL01026066.1.p1  ORF type:complete len:844 (-),score=157.09 GHVL01026066.1:68-2599(-)
MNAEEKIERLREKCQKLKNSNTLLKQCLIDQEADMNKLQENLQQTQLQLRSTVEELEKISFEKRQIESEKQKVTGASSGPSNSSGTWVGSAIGALGGTQLTLLKDELTIKITENENLHMKTFELKKEHEKIVKGLEEKMQSLQDNNKQLQVKIQFVINEKESILAESNQKSLDVEMLQKQYETAVAQFQKNEDMLVENETRLQKELDMCRAIIRRNVLVDIGAIDIWAMIGSPHWEIRKYRKQIKQAVSYLWTDVRCYLQSLVGVLKSWPKLASMGNNSSKHDTPLPITQRKIQVACNDLYIRIQTCISNPTFHKNTDSFSEWLKLFKSIVNFQCLSWVLADEEHSSGGKTTSPYTAAFTSVRHSSGDRTFTTQTLVSTMRRLHKSHTSVVKYAKFLFGLPHSASPNASQLHRAAMIDDLYHVVANKKFCASPKAVLFAVSKLHNSINNVAHSWELLSKGVTRALTSSNPVNHNNSDPQLPSSDDYFSGADSVAAIIYEISTLAKTPRIFESLKTIQNTVTNNNRRAVMESAHRLNPSINCDDPEDEWLSSVNSALINAESRITFKESVLLRNNMKEAVERQRLGDESYCNLNRELALAVEESERLKSQLLKSQDEYAVLEVKFQQHVQKNKDLLLSPPRCQIEEIADESLDESTENVFNDPAVLNDPAVPSPRDDGEERYTAETITDDVMSMVKPKSSREMRLLKVYICNIKQIQAKIHVTNEKTLKIKEQMDKYYKALQTSEEQKSEIELQVQNLRKLLENNKDESVRTRQSYDDQIALLTEHICDMSSNLSEKDANIISLHSHKMLCGRCGVWNTVGQLLSTESGGTCHVCRGRVAEAAV